MLIDTASAQENYQRFVNRVVESEEAWTLSASSGVAVCESHNDEDVSVILFFSDEAYARRARGQFPEYEPKRLDLFELLYRWLPGMSGDGILAGPNWTGELAGLEIDPFEMRETIESGMREEQLDAFSTRYQRETGQ